LQSQKDLGGILVRGEDYVKDEINLVSFGQFTSIYLAGWGKNLREEVLNPAY